MRLPWLVLPFSLVCAGVAAAHVTLAPAQAAPGGYYAGLFRVSHGCDGSATLALRVETPEGVVSAKPQPKPGWTVEIEREPLATPVAGEGGKLIRQRVKAVTWRGRLADDQFDEFGLLAKLPSGQGPIYFPVVQTCETGSVRWVDIPKPGQAWHDAPHPAPVVTLAAPVVTLGPGGRDDMAGMHLRP